ncbi:hypothetical protein SCLCIDRAFT_1213956 [Scleroderma citrinum Foug A]|uniref:Uncharacterized protein n=1 Tax=Scleroderma citrinum Foug A TaxID=1036808 RepID=A0A0C3DT42_9AGAM|nr:hypothetical protein SCLCIDRAFT_1213956 [Scleroderma citrinum Foug A]
MASSPNDRYINDPAHEGLTPSNSASTSTMTDSVSPLPTASSSPQFSEKGKPLSVFQRPTLGRIVRLGELFDERRNQFLGVQLTLSLSNSVEDKSNVLDINASLALDVLGGLVPVRGSASYLRSSKTNSQKRSWAMALKMRTEEHRLLFAELDSKVVEGVKEYFTPAATHFVSAITYGGKIVINMTERSSDLTGDDIGGSLELELDRLKSTISLKGDAVADVKGEFNVRCTGTFGSTRLHRVQRMYLMSFPTQSTLSAEVHVERMVVWLVTPRRITALKASRYLLPSSPFLHTCEKMVRLIWTSFG